MRIVRNESGNFTKFKELRIGTTFIVYKEGCATHCIDDIFLKIDLNDSWNSVKLKYGHTAYITPYTAVIIVYGSWVEDGAKLPDFSPSDPLV